MAKNVDTVQRYFSEVHGRNSFDNNGAVARFNIHDSVDNAFWEPSKKQFYMSDSSDGGSFVTLDVCAHEFTHAITQHTAGLVYLGEAGAINESFSDVFGTIVEFFAQPDGRGFYPGKASGAADWLIGEDRVSRGIGLRDLKSPLERGDPSRFRGTFWSDPLSDRDHGGVHSNSGVQNHMFYLLCEGGTGINDGISYSVKGIGITNAARLAFRALTVYSRATDDYHAARSRWLAAAKDLNPLWVESVEAAWFAVGVAKELDLSVALDASNLSWVSGGENRWVGDLVTSRDGLGSARSGPAPDNGESRIETTITGPGTLSFWWKVSSEYNMDFLRNGVDGVEVGRITGEVDWQPRVYQIGPGVHKIWWQYVKNRSDKRGLDSGWLDQVIFDTRAPDLSEVYVDWRNKNPNPDGTISKPYPSFELGYNRLADRGVMKIRSGKYYYPQRSMVKQLRLDSYDGKVVVDVMPASNGQGAGTEVPVIAQTYLDQEGLLRISFATVQGSVYRVITSTDLKSWEILSEFIAESEEFDYTLQLKPIGSNGDFERDRTNETGDQTRYYQIVVVE